MARMVLAEDQKVHIGTNEPVLVWIYVECIFVNLLVTSPRVLLDWFYDTLKNIRLRLSKKNRMKISRRKKREIVVLTFFYQSIQLIVNKNYSMLIIKTIEFLDYISFVGFSWFSRRVLSSDISYFTLKNTILFKILW